MAKKILITSALPYVNNIPHLGNIIGCVLSADVFARYARMKGLETFFVCATDEYGTATETKALEAGKTPQEICDYYHEIHKNVYKNFQISFDYFGRTTYPEQTELTQGFFRDLEAHGFILEKETEQLFCEKDQLFLADRYVEGICPHCGYDQARGDQCERCSKLLSPTELKTPRCRLCGTEPIFKKTHHLYLDLSKLAKDLQKFHDGASKQGFWPENAKAVTKAWMEQGLQPRPITRDLKWGVPVPKKGYEQKVFYVWFDAVVGYISNTKRALPETWLSWWQNGGGVELYQFMAKDNIPFHTVILPAMELGSQRPWTMLHHIASSEYLNYENAKFSKSRGIGVFGNDVENTGIDIDLWRFYLLVNRPEVADSQFLWDEFYLEVHSNFIDNLGNLLNRVLVFVEKQMNGSVAFPSVWTMADQDFAKAAAELKAKYTTAMDRVELRVALRLVLEYGRLGNKFFQEQKPWALFKSDKARAEAVLATLMASLIDMGQMLQPFMPGTAEKMFRQLNHSAQSWPQPWPTPGTHLKTGPVSILFPKLEKELFLALKEKFANPEEKKQKHALLERAALLVGQVRKVEPAVLRHLSRLTVDFGPYGLKTVLAGLQSKLSPSQLLGQKLVFVYNLEPVDFGGETSEGMLLLANKKNEFEPILTNQALGTRLSTQGQAQSLPDGSFSLEELKELKLKVRNSYLVSGEQPLYLGTEPVRLKSILNGKVI